MVSSAVSAKSVSAEMFNAVSSAPNASFVGANTSMGPGKDSTSVRLAALTAATSVDRSGAEPASSPIVGTSALHAGPWAEATAGGDGHSCQERVRSARGIRRGFEATTTCGHQGTQRETRHI